MKIIPLKTPVMPPPPPLSPRSSLKTKRTHVTNSKAPTPLHTLLRLPNKFKKKLNTASS